MGNIIYYATTRILFKTFQVLTDLDHLIGSDFTLINILDYSGKIPEYCYL